MQALAEMADRHGALLPQHHHGYVLRVGEVQVGEAGPVALHNRMRCGIEGEAELVVEGERVESLREGPVRLV